MHDRAYQGSCEQRVAAENLHFFHRSIRLHYGLHLDVYKRQPLDPSLNSASVLTGTRVARNWIGVVGALVSDLTLQFFGIGAFLLPVFPALLGMRWFASRKIQAPVAKSLGVCLLYTSTHL